MGKRAHCLWRRGLGDPCTRQQVVLHTGERIGMCRPEPAVEAGCSLLHILHMPISIPSPSSLPPPLFSTQRVFSTLSLPPIGGRDVQDVQQTTGRVLRGLWPAHPNPLTRVQSVHDLSPLISTAYIDNHTRAVLDCIVSLARPNGHITTNEGTKQ